MNMQRVLIAVLVIFAIGASCRDTGKTTAEAQALYKMAQRLEFSSQPGDLERAAQTYQSAAGIFESRGDNVSLVNTLNRLGQVHIRLGRNNKGVECFQKALELARKIQNPDLEKTAARNLADALKDGAQAKTPAVRAPQQPIGREDQSLPDKLAKPYTHPAPGKDLAESTPPPTELLEFITTMLGLGEGSADELERKVGKVVEYLAKQPKFSSAREAVLVSTMVAEAYLRLGQYAKSLKYSTDILEASRRSGDRFFEASSLMTIGQVYAKWKLYAKAAESLTQALDTLRASDAGVGREVLAPKILNELALAYAYQGQHEKAIELFNESLDLKGRIGDFGGQITTHGNLGGLYRELGQYDKSEEHFVNALSISRKHEQPNGQQDSLLRLAEVKEMREDLRAALQYYKDSLPVSQKLGDEKEKARSLNRIGMLNDRLGEFQEAIRYYSESLPLFKNINDPTGWATAVNNIGLVHSKLKRYPKAISYYKQSIDAYRDIGNFAGQTTTLVNLGFAHLGMGDKDEGLKCLETALSTAKSSGNLQLEFIVSRELEALRTGKPHDRLRDVEHSYADETKTTVSPGGRVVTDSPRDAGIKLMSEGRELIAQQRFPGDLAVGIDKLNQAAALLHQAGMTDFVAEIANELGAHYIRMGEFDWAAHHFLKALALAQEKNDREQEAGALSNLAVVYGIWGRYDKALECLDKALAISKQLKDTKQEASITHNLAHLLSYAFGRHDTALEYSKHALATFKRLGDPNGVGKCLMAMGRTYKQLGQYRKALDMFEEGVAVHEKAGLPKQMFTILMGDTYLDLGDVRSAEPLVFADNHAALVARIYLVSMDYEKAGQWYEKLRKWAEEINAANELLTAYTGLGIVAEHRGEFKIAAENFRKATQITEELRSRLPADLREGFFGETQWGLGRTTPYEGLSRVLMRLNLPVEALEQSEHTKARVFAEAVSKITAVPAQSIPGEILAKDRNVSDRVAALKRQLQEAREKRFNHVIETLEPQIRQLEIELQAHVRMLRAQYPLFAAAQYPQPMSLFEADLRDDEWVLAYDLTDSGVLIYLTKGKKLIRGLFKPVERKKVDGLVEELTKPMAVKSTEDLVNKLYEFKLDTGRELANILISDVLSDIPPGVPLIVVPDDSLGLIPFEMLVLGGNAKLDYDAAKPKPGLTLVGDVRFFGDRNPISYQHSITALTLARIHGEKKKPGDRTLVMADPVFTCSDDRAPKACEQVPLSDAAKGSGDSYSAIMGYMKERGLILGRLRSTGHLAGSLEQMFPGRADVYTGLKASKETFFSEEVTKKLRDYAKIVFATHGLYDKDTPVLREPFLVLTTVPKGVDGFLRMREVMGSKMNADVAALEACQTGVGKVLSGEGTMAMGRAFQHAGARSVLISLWNVYEDAGTKLTERFLQHREDGKSKLEALQLARKELREKGYDHPFFWAAFILVGEVN